jgi:predicted DCC family thiol-disulfide oxidoreductase YuxK
MEATPIIVLIDGDCALCNRTAQWFAARDPRGAMVFAPNNGESARILGEPPGGDQGTVVVWVGSRRLVRSAAVLRMLSGLGGGWGRLAWSLGWVPVRWADVVYGLVARRRHWFGRPAACTLLSPQHLAD